MKEHNTDPFTNAMKQLKKAAVILKKSGLDGKAYEMTVDEYISGLSEPERIINVMLPIRMDNGILMRFQGYRVQYNNYRGPYKGGIRFHPDVNLSEVKALSFWMAMKCAVADLPLGGGKGGIVVDPKVLSMRELEALSRAYVRAIADVIGPDIDVPAPDVNTNSTIMGWMADEYIAYKCAKGMFTMKDKTKLMATFTGKSVDNGGSEGREEATGLGGIYVLKSFLKKQKTSGKQLTAAVMGFGNVGYNIVRFLNAEGIRVVAVSDSKGGIYVPEGVNPELTMECKKKNGFLAGCYCSGSVCDLSKGKQIPLDELLTLDVDILVPAALENVITAENAGKIKASVILEMANGPTAPDADPILRKRGISVIPDILANSGGVTVSAFEWKQNLKNLHWSKTEVNRKLRTYMESATDAVWDEMHAHNCDMRTAAFIIALKRMMPRRKR
jgi:glutamate dehydrogenase (NADP+)